MRTPCDLTRDELEAIVDQLQRALYLDDDAEPSVWNPDKSWEGAEICARLGDLLIEHDLVPLP